jgi:hypothetical protein
MKSLYIVFLFAFAFAVPAHAQTASQAVGPRAKAGISDGLVNMAALQ